MLEWISWDDLGPAYKKARVEHQADAVRLALMAKYGGVWMDASIILFKPLSEVIGSHPDGRIFMNLDRYEGGSMKAHRTYKDTRLGPHFFVENWFLAFAADDPGPKRFDKCLLELQQLNEDGQMSWRDSGFFTKVQLEWLVTLGIALGSSEQDNYLSMHACVMKVITDSKALSAWFTGPNVQHIDAQKAAFSAHELVGWNDEGLRALAQKLLGDSVDEALMKHMTRPHVLMMKVPGQLRRVWKKDFDKQVTKKLLSEAPTLQKLLGHYGIRYNATDTTSSAAGETTIICKSRHLLNTLKIFNFAC